MLYIRGYGMDKLAQKAADFLGSTWVIVGFGGWMIVHTILQKDYISFISELAIWIGLMILRAEAVQAEETDRAVKKDLKASERIEKKLDKK